MQKGKQVEERHGRKSTNAQEPQYRPKRALCISNLRSWTDCRFSWCAHANCTRYMYLRSQAKNSYPSRSCFCTAFINSAIASNTGRGLWPWVAGHPKRPGDVLEPHGWNMGVSKKMGHLIWTQNALVCMCYLCGGEWAQNDRSPLHIRTPEKAPSMCRNSLYHWSILAAIVHVPGSSARVLC